MLSSRTLRSLNRATALLRLAAVNVGKTETALGAFYRRLAARIGKAKAVTATARKVAAIFFKVMDSTYPEDRKSEYPYSWSSIATTFQYPEGGS